MGERQRGGAQFRPMRSRCRLWRWRPRIARYSISGSRRTCAADCLSARRLLARHDQGIVLLYRQKLRGSRGGICCHRVWAVPGYHAGAHDRSGRTRHRPFMGQRGEIRIRSRPVLPRRSFVRRAPGRHGAERRGYRKSPRPTRAKVLSARTSAVCSTSRRSRRPISTIISGWTMPVSQRSAPCIMFRR